MSSIQRIEDTVEDTNDTTFNHIMNITSSKNSRFNRSIRRNQDKMKKSSDRNTYILNLYCDYMNKFTISKINISLNEISKNKFPIESFLQYVKQKICLYCSN